MAHNDRTINVADESRPLTFTDVVGQIFATGVGKRIGEGRISGQGYILSGPKGCGKTSVARIIARSVNCEHRDTQTGDPCNECSSCQLALKDAHPYINEINAAAHRGINDIKNVLQSMNLSVDKGMRVYILDEVHMLTKEAFNVLLKPMENPPRNVMFIATTTNPEAIPDTIVSRVPVIPINPLSPDDLHDVLHNVVEKNKQYDDVWNDVTEEDIDYAMMSAQGSARQAITTLSGIVYHGVSQHGEKEYAGKIVNAMMNENVRETLSCARQACQDKTTHPATLLQAIMDMLFDQIGASSHPARDAAQIAKLSGVVSEVSSSTPALLVAAKIADCVSVHAEEEKGHKGNSSVRKKVSGHNDNDVQLHVTSQTTIDDVIHHLLDTPSSRKKLGKHWVNVLDNPDESSIDVHQGKVSIAVSRPSSQLRKTLEELLDSVSVTKIT